MADADIAFAGIARQAELIRGGEISSRELTELYLRRIEELDPRLNAFRTVFHERARTEAEAADRHIAGGEQAPMLGVPVALKDELADLEGDTTMLGTGAFDAPATADSKMVARIRAAGAVIIGKTNLPELAICGFTESKTWGATRNPWNPDRSPGGSSGGSAAAVAAGMAGIASGSDGAGSIRIPAAFCGLFGLKVQRGRIPTEPPDHWRGLSVNGCLSRTVADTALFLDVVTAGGGDPVGPPAPARPFAESARESPGKLRIGVSEKPARVILPPKLDDLIRGGLADAEELLTSLGHEVFRADPEFGLAGNNLVPRYLRGCYDDVKSVPHPHRLEARTRGFGRLGAMYPEWLVARACRGAERDARRINAIFERCDVLVTPTTGEPPIEVGRWEGKGALATLLGMSRTYAYTPIWNHTGQPAAAVPVGFTHDGLPLSVTLVARPNDEATLISLAAQIEAERPWTDRRPPVS